MQNSDLDCGQTHSRSWRVSAKLNSLAAPVDRPVASAALCGRHFATDSGRSRQLGLLPSPVVLGAGALWRKSERLRECVVAGAAADSDNTHSTCPHQALSTATVQMDNDSLLRRTVGHAMYILQVREE